MSFTKEQSIASAKQRRQQKRLLLKGNNFQFVSGEAEKFIEQTIGLKFPKPSKGRGRGCRVSNRDVEATKARFFANKKSYVRLDGSEVLYGNDWRQRKAELWARCGGRCERIVEWDPINGSMRCRSDANDAHHKIKRSKGRNDRLDQLEALCRMHHDLLDERKVRWSKEGAD